MADEVVGALWKDAGLRAVCAVTTDLSRHARTIHRAYPSSAELLAKALTAAQLLSALQLGKGDGRINFQVECDGPVRGLLADADGEGGLRGYAKNALVEVKANSDAFRWRPALGNKGYLSVLRELGGGELARSAVELKDFDLAGDLGHFFAASEQVETRVALECVAHGAEPLGAVAGIVVQLLPEGSRQALDDIAGRFSAFQNALGEGVSAGDLVKTVRGVADLELTSRLPLAYRCRCSRERVINALTAMGPDELEDLLVKEGKVDVTCEFCATRYEIGAKELLLLIQRLQGD